MTLMDNEQAIPSNTENFGRLVTSTSDSTVNVNRDQEIEVTYDPESISSKRQKQSTPAPESISYPHIIVKTPNDSNPQSTECSKKTATAYVSGPGQTIDTVQIPRSIESGHAAAAWAYFRALGSPKYHVAPMVDQSELPFRMLCRKYGATAAYTPMLHSRLFAEEPKYRKEFTTCKEDRPLFVQFCANNPDTLLAAAKLVEGQTDYVDINFGCPQRIARRGNYGAFLMDNLPLVHSLVKNLSSNLAVPVSCKIRMFPELEKTLAYARMLEDAGCSLLAVHGRTRDQKNQKTTRADWNVIRAVKQVVQIPVLANGNVRWLEDAKECMLFTGVDGVLSADSLLENPALFSGCRLSGNEGEVFEEPSRGLGKGSPNHISLLLEYLELCEMYPVPMRMIRGHVHKMVGPWFRVHTDLRERLNKEQKITVAWLKDLIVEMKVRNERDLSLRPMYGETEE